MFDGPMARASRPGACVTLAALLLLHPLRLAAQADSAGASRDSTRTIERVLVTAFRASALAPIAETTVPRSTITRRQFGQDVPLLLVGAVPSITAHTETGTNWGYSYLRLRGMDQTRINITIDGVPLNDMEDQVLYFANIADLMSSVQSVQVQRGVGTSSAGTASFAGSVNFETVPVGRRDAEGELQLQVGSFGSRRVSASFRGGIPGTRLSVYGRAGAVTTNGYRDHSGVRGGSAFVGAGWFGDRDVLKLTTLVGVLRDTLSYTGATLEELQTNRRFNPLDPSERDAFAQQMVALSYTRLFGAATSFTTTAYRNSAAGSYDYLAAPDRYRFNLDHWWYGVTSAVNHAVGDWRFNLGVNGNTYARDHRGYLEPSTTLYENTGHKQDVSLFGKASLAAGPLRWFGDVQVRHTRFRYTPDAAAGIGERAMDWTFLNPKIGVTVPLRAGITAFASVGRTAREPARSDLLAGDDDLNAGNVEDYGDFGRVRPESVRDLELGVSVARSRWDLSVNLYDMNFRNDIARIGAPTASGSVLRRNVGASYRRGIEVDARWQPIERLALGGNATWSTNRIRAFTDSSRGVPVVRRNVEPLLTPRLLTTQRADLTVTKSLLASIEGRYQSRAFLDNTGSVDRVLPAYYQLDAAVRVVRARYALTVRAVNLANNDQFGSGSVSSSGTVRYFVLPARSLFATFDVAF
ncbi:MAG: TonB-dependent receptor plug domain-containing protein [Gemmatimonadaceae bacterium]|nr:TonB-dependent receptor plug domain-containing protein [Gemmatimonadaceae bacterium]